MIIAVDFDGTIVKHKYPEIGEPIPFAIETLLRLQEKGHKLILWSVREGELLDDAVAYCRAKGLEFYAVNRNYPEEETDHKAYSRKLQADMFIDDRNVGGMLDWGVIYKLIVQNISLNNLLEYVDGFSPKYEKKTFLKRLFGG